MCDIYDVIESSYGSADVIVSTVYDYGEKNLGNGIRKLASDMFNSGKYIGYEECFNKVVPVAYDMGKTDGLFIGSLVTAGLGTIVTLASLGIYKLIQRCKTQKGMNRGEFEQDQEVINHENE